MISFASVISCNAVIAGENGAENFFISPPAALSLQTNHLQLTPKGAIRALTAFEWRSDWQAPITQSRGDLYRLGVLRFDFGVATNVSLQIRGAVWQILKLQNDSNQPAVSDQSATDVGDFSVGTLVRLVPNKKHRPALGLRIETKLPNTNQDRGIGTNTTDLTLSVLATQQYARTLLFADVGIGILSAPRQLNEQNDVLVYGFGFSWAVKPALQLAGEVNGFYSPRQQIPVGTEDRSAARLGLVWKSEHFALEMLLAHGLTEREGNWGVSVGLSWQMQLFQRQGMQVRSQ